MSGEGSGGGGCAPAMRVHASTAEGFTMGTVAAYEKGRPEWSGDVVDRLMTMMKVVESGAATSVVELAAGTGKFTRPLAAWLKEHGVPATGWCIVEPTDMVKAVADIEASGVRVIRSTADALPFPTNSVGGIVAAQAFHWFANEESLTEMCRVLVPGGTMAFCWNMRAPQCSGQGPAWAQAVEAIIDQYYDDDTPRASTHAWKRAIEAFPGLTGHTYERVVREDHVGTEADMVAWVLSISIISKRSPELKADIADRVRAILRREDTPFTTSAEGAKLYTMPMYTELYWARKLPAATT